MNWKEFLKPEWRKIVLFIILSILISVYVYDWLLNNVVVCKALVCPTVEQVAQENMIRFLPFILIISYFLSCFILWIYNKVKKK